MVFQPSDTLRSRTYLGLIASQFLAAFNDQATHIVAIFYASDMLVRYAGVPGIDEKAVISIVTACFILPFFLFSTLAGMLADRYSKRSTLVFWKMAEVGMMGLALFGFLLPHAHTVLGWGDPKVLAVWSAGIVIATVFLMGTHSAFFVPAKYGVMPEILTHSVLSRGNGFLEATSFVAQIVGTSFGGFLYVLLRSDLDGDQLALGQEWCIGVLLFGLAILGAACSLLIERMPPAMPDRPLTWKLWQPLSHNVGVLLRSRPLALAVLGIAFFAFITLYARQTLLYNGEALKDLNEVRGRVAEVTHEKQVEETDFLSRTLQKTFPNMSAAQRAEFQVALLIALVGLGIGIGAPLAGWASGDKVELGLVPIGTFFLILFTLLLALLTYYDGGKIVCLTLIGVAAGFYIVPLYTLLQHRAPKDSKGNLVATSNFVNVVGGLVAVGVFWLVTAALEVSATMGQDPNTVVKTMPVEPRDPKDPVLQAAYLEKLASYQQYVYTKTHFTPILFLTASLMTCGIMILLGWQLPDFSTRTLLWLRSLFRYRLQVVGMNNLPSDGPVILVTNCKTIQGCLQVLTATDRFTRFVLVESPVGGRLPWLLRYLTNRTHLAVLRPGSVNAERMRAMLNDAVEVLDRGEMVGLPAEANGAGFDVDAFLHELRGRKPGAQVVPVYCGPTEPDPTANGARFRAKEVWVVICQPHDLNTHIKEIREELRIKGEWIKNLQKGGPAPSDLTTGKIPGASGASPTAPGAIPPAPP